MVGLMLKRSKFLGLFLYMACMLRHSHRLCQACRPGRWAQIRLFQGPRLMTTHGLIYKSTSSNFADNLAIFQWNVCVCVFFVNFSRGELLFKIAEDLEKLCRKHKKSAFLETHLRLTLHPSTMLLVTMWYAGIPKTYENQILIHHWGRSR